jgi:YVTN family beta-propeller protein
MIAKIPAGHRPRSIGFLPDGSRAYVTLENDGALALIDSQRHKFLKLVQLEGKGNTPKPRPMGIAMRPDGKALYVTTGSFGNVFFINPENNRGADSLPVGQRPWGIALSPDLRTIYTANGPSNDVSAIDLVTKEVKKIPAGQRPWGIAIIKSR